MFLKARKQRSASVIWNLERGIISTEKFLLALSHCYIVKDSDIESIQNHFKKQKSQHVFLHPLCDLLDFLKTSKQASCMSALGSSQFCWFIYLFILLLEWSNHILTPRGETQIVFFVPKEFKSQHCGNIHYHLSPSKAPFLACSSSMIALDWIY